MKLISQFIVLLILIVSCKVSEPQVHTQEEDLQNSEIIEDSVEKSEPEYELRVYRGEQTRHFKLLHTKLEVSFDWQKQHLLGKASLILQPYFYEQSNVELDAKDFIIHKVSILNGSDTLIPDYNYDGEKLNVEFGQAILRDMKLHLAIDYTAKPNEGKDSLDFSNDKSGLYFIDPYDSIKNKPQQIWTHGETTTSSKWFPTIDAPNQKSTQEIFITVDDRFTTLSNGNLIYSKSNPDGTRTDYWKMDKPHAPYLFMMAIGEFAVVEDAWNGKSIDYYVEPEYEKYAEDIFGRTPEMIHLFSEILNYPYPWNKYSQVVVRDFVSGAMENTTASVFMEDLQVNSRELIDYNWDDIIAHELFHQWFGDLVTCESWANIPLNESFATYGEYLWKNHKYGKDEGDFHLYEELQTYLDEATEKQLNLIRFDYLDEDEMFDSHSYAKGGLILHMLRDYLGDEAFFKSLEYYLKKHEYGKTEVHELRLAFEYISGEDLNWFFNQWFLDAGHPVLKVEDEYDAENRTVTLKVWQEQNLELYPVYKLPLILDLWEKENKSQYLVEIDRPYQEFEFENVSHPDLLLLDSDYILVGEINHSKSIDQWDFQYQHYDSTLRARYEAFLQLINVEEEILSDVMVKRFLADPFWVIREEALLAIEQDTTDLYLGLEKRVIDLADKDSNSLVKAAAISTLAAKEKEKYQAVFRKQLYDSSYAVSGNALYAYLQTLADDIPEIVDSLRMENNFSISSSIADYYILQQDHAQYPWFEQKLQIYSGSDLWYFTKLFGMYLITAPPDIAKQGINELAMIAKYHNQYYNRLSAYQSLQLLSDFEGVSEILSAIKEAESDPRIIGYYD